MSAATSLSSSSSAASASSSLDKHGWEWADFLALPISKLAVLSASIRDLHSALSSSGPDRSSGLQTAEDVATAVTAGAEAVADIVSSDIAELLKFTHGPTALRGEKVLRRDFFHVDDRSASWSQDNCDVVILTTHVVVFPPDGKAVTV